MTYEIFLMRVMHRTGIDEPVVAQKMIQYALEGLAHCLPREMADQLDGLPEPLATELRENIGAQPCNVERIYAQVADELSVDLSFGLEFSQVVFQVIGESVGPTGRRLLREHLDSSWHQLFEPRRTIMTPRGRQLRPGRTLAGAQAGSRRPLSEAQPGHRNSIAHTEHPRSGTDLATSHGKPERRTLASGKPGSSRPISDA
jgi:uncharacterized protein (DUF2267 family)